MQFKHPELLWALLLLLIPIFIHLFQLRKFKRTPFTNVKFLQKVVSKSRKSNRLKEWLLLATRMLLLTALILAFAQPFFAKATSLKEKETVIYLDNSFSMQAKTNNESLLSTAIQELLKAIPKENPFSLFTNDKVYKDVDLKDIQNDLLSVSFTEKQLSLEDIYLKAKTFFSPKENTIKNVVVISDFQRRMVSNTIDSTSKLQKHLVQLVPDQLDNIAIDSVYIRNTSPENIEVVALLSSNSAIESTPVSLFNGEKLIAKTAANFKENKKAEVLFSLPSNQIIDGKIQISNTGLSYDNELFFNIDKKEKIKVLVISETNDSYLKKIFSNDEFTLGSYSLNELRYSSLEENNLIILNELNSIPNALQNTLRSFKNNGGSILIIPSKRANIDSYNLLTRSLFNTSFVEQIKTEKNITSIAFSHPLYKNVFQKNTTNFQYPKVSQYFKIKTTAPKLLSLDDGSPFLIGIDGFYLFTASISTENSNFKNSPLIVPILYNIGLNSLKLPKLYNLLGNKTIIDVSGKLAKDNILRVKQGDHEFIPQQRSFANKVSLTFDDYTELHGIYSIINEDTPIKNISFNYQKNESKLVYIDIANLNASTKQGSITSLFNTMENEASVTKLWKRFIILALLFILIEVLIQKYLK